MPYNFGLTRNHPARPDALELESLARGYGAGFVVGRELSYFVAPDDGDARNYARRLDVLKAVREALPGLYEAMYGLPASSHHHSYRREGYQGRGGL